MVEGVGGKGVFGFVWMDEEGFFVIEVFDVGFGGVGFQVEDGVGVQVEGFEDVVDFGVLGDKGCQYYCWENGDWIGEGWDGDEGG